MNTLRKSVLQGFKKLHRTRVNVFNGDTKALLAARVKINEEFRKNKNVTDQEAIKAMLKYAQDVETELRTQVIQAKEVSPGVFEAKITGDTVMLENISFNDKAAPDGDIPGGRPCCKDQQQNK